MVEVTLSDAMSRLGRTRRLYCDSADTQLGLLAMKRQLDRVEDYIALGKQSADLVTGGQRPAHMNTGYFLEPKLFANVGNRSRIAQEEIFGLVPCLIPAKDEEDATRIANDSACGLNGSALTHDVDAANRMARRVRTAGFEQNGMKMEFGLPFGGFKEPGIGRDGGPGALAAYAEPMRFFWMGNRRR